MKNFILPIDAPEWLYYLLFISGFVLLIKGADVLIDGSSYLAYKLKIPQIVVGLTVVAFGTSAPEFVINLVASLNESGDIALGNIIGSNIANTFLILGVASLICPLLVKKNTFRIEIPFSILCILVLALLSNDFWRTQPTENTNHQLDLLDGSILLFFFVGFLYYTYRISRKKPKEKIEIKELKVHRAILYIIFGLVGLTLGGQWIYESSLFIARSFGVSEFIIAVSLVAIGTSLPELATSVAAAFKKNTDIAIGNVVGSNIFNILWVLGFSSVVNPITIRSDNFYDLLAVLLSSLLLFLALLFSKEKVLKHWHGVFFLSIYVLYVWELYSA